MDEDLLGPLRDTPVPPLAPAAALRARGEQRRRRRRAAVGGAAALTLVLAGGTAAALTGLDGSDDLRPAPFASSGPTAAPTTAPTRAWSLPDAFLTTAEAAAAEDPGWVVDTGLEQDRQAPAADPCREGRIPVQDRLRDQGEQAMSSTREAGGSSLHQEVYRYASAEDAARAFAEYEEQYLRCASVPNPDADGPGWTTRSEIRQQQLTPGGGSLLVRSIPCAPEGGCTVHFASYAMVVQEADALTVVAYLVGEDGDPAEAAAALLDAVQSRLGRVVSG